MENNQQWAENVLAKANIKINGSRPFDMQVKNPLVFNRVLAKGTLGLGESYMDGWWEAAALDEFFDHVLSANLQDTLKLSLSLVGGFLKARLFNLQAVTRAFEVGQKHYDLGNDFFVAMLGESMTYSCGYWKNAKDITQAEYAKLDLVCRKLNLQPGQRILEIGSGWGSFAKYAAEKYGVSVVGVTVSKEQAEFAKEFCKGLPVEFRLQDYRKLNEKFDHIVSIGMFEHVGLKNYKTYMKVARRCLKENGLFLLHTIGGPISRTSYEPWLNKYIFPNALIPSLAQITKNIEKLFIVEDVHNFGADYDKTLMAWHKNFEANWPKFKDQYDEKFYRMWRYYLLMCAGLFRSRSVELWQIVLSPNGVKGGYQSVR